MIRTVPRVVWLIVALNILLLSTYTTLFPLYRPPDETSHLDQVLAAKNQQGWPEERMTAQRTVASYGEAAFVRREVTPLPIEAASDRDERPTFEELAPLGGLTEFSNPAAQHPPLYYTISGTALLVVNTMIPSAYDWSFDQVVGFVRYLNVAMAAPLPLLIFLSGRRVLADERLAIAAAMIPLALPQLTHIGAAVNNDNMLNLLLATMALVLARVAAGTRGRRDAWIVGGLGGAALLTKGFALLVIPWIVFAYLVGERRVSKHAIMAGLRKSAAPVAVGLAIGGWWWVRNVLVAGTVQPLGRVRDQLPDDQLPPTSEWVVRVPVLLVQRFWGSFSRYDVNLPRALVVGAALLLMLAVAAALWSHRRRDLRRRLGLVALMCAPAAATLVIILYGSYGIFRTDGEIAGLQGRYLFTGLTGLALLAATGWGYLIRGRALWLGILALALVIQGAAISAIVPTYWTASEAGSRLEALLAWSPWHPGYVVATWCALGVTLVALVASLFVEQVRTGDDTRRSPAGGRGTRAAVKAKRQ